MQKDRRMVSKAFLAFMIVIGLGQIALGLDYMGWVAVLLGALIVISGIVAWITSEREFRTRTLLDVVVAPSEKRP